MYSLIFAFFIDGVSFMKFSKNSQITSILQFLYTKYLGIKSFSLCFIISLGNPNALNKFKNDMKFCFISFSVFNNSYVCKFSPEKLISMFSEK